MTMHLLTKVVALENEASEFGFYWEKAEQIMEQIHSECHEVNEHLHMASLASKADLKEETGDLLHAVLSLCIFLKMEPQDILQQSIEKFSRRLQAVKEITYERELPDLKQQSFAVRMDIWQQAKERVG